MTDPIFHTPGRADDALPEPIPTDWDRWQRHAAQENLAVLKALVPGAADATIPYVNPADQALPAGRTSVPVEWQGFPARIEQLVGQDNPEKYAAAADKGSEDLYHTQLGGTPRAPAPPAGFRWAFVDSALGTEVDLRARHRQDEYLEWEACFDDRGVLRSITFVAEGYDYWDFLFTEDDKLTAEKYSELIKADVSADDLRFAHDIDLYFEPLPHHPGQRQRVQGPVFGKGQFNWRNQFNQGPGIVHLSHRANSLGAEINLAVTSALPRTDAKNQPVVANPVQRLLCCTAGGDPNRASDPHIAAAAYAAVVDTTQPKFFTLTDPIGLYISDFRYTALQYPKDPTKHSAYEWWRVERGHDASDPTHTDRTDSRIMRLHLEVPREEGFQLGEMTIEGGPIIHPAQLAELVKMHLLVDVWSAPAKAPSAPCGATCCTDKLGLLTLSDGPCPTGTTSPFPDLIAAPETPALSSPMFHAVGLKRR